MSADYTRRIVDDELDSLFPEIPAFTLDGPKFVGKTTTALQRARDVIAIDDPAVQQTALTSPSSLLTGPRPILVDEWQKAPPIWDAVRRSIDAGPRDGGQFLLTGSATPSPEATTHSGAGRIVRLRMRPMTLAERGVVEPTVSLRDLLSRSPTLLSERSPLTFDDYVREITASGLPQLRGLSRRALSLQLRSYVQNLVDRDIPELGESVRRRGALLDWLRAYAAATSTTTSYKTIIERATPGDPDRPARGTADRYRDLLRQIWVLDPVDAWDPPASGLGRLSTTPKHHLMDPALAAHLLQVTPEKLLRGAETSPMPPQGTVLGNLFESLTTLCLRVAAQAADADVRHLRTRNGEHEVDLILESHDGGIVAVEVKLSGTVGDKDVKHLTWLRSRLGDRLTDALVVTTGPSAYRRDDGIGVVPLGLIGP